MNRLVVFVFAGLFAILNFIQPALAEKKSLNPADNCGSVLRYDSRVDKIMVGLWAFGYLSKSTGQGKIADPQTNEKVLKYLAYLCNKTPGSSFGNVVEQFAKILTKPKTSSTDARNVIRQFMAPNADHLKLTKALLPTARDIRTVFAEPLASKLVALYAERLSTGFVIKPKAKHTDFLTVQTTTGKLKNRDPIDYKFSGGLKKAAPYFLVDIPIARFKFVKAGETLGLTFDSLYFVNGRWVIMPKPWWGLK